jgi:hypothetical protein
MVRNALTGNSMVASGSSAFKKLVNASMPAATIYKGLLVSAEMRLQKAMDNLSESGDIS